MGERYLVDSNVIIGYLDNKISPKGMSFINALIDDTPNISVITKIELLRFNAPPAAYKILTDFTDASVIYDLNNAVVDATIIICKQNKIKLPDAIIAATALVHNLLLATRNIADFKNINDLQVINPWDI
jgi:predicted nucleic acid-binding protein